ncbi:IQ domain-containing protein C [Chanos chanos]|uniref:IQ domain-containing protein C n=1 Tax=Chanos chanos TaxID=29144 RepID=A0A6J2V7C1_CHACN|nr:IQ domain-containing protein C [Chanos chanos]
MEGQELLRRITGFQGCARGYLVRKEMRSVQVEFEDIVREIDGDVDHLEWRGSFLPIPHFHDDDYDNPLQTILKVQSKGKAERPVMLEEPNGESDVCQPVTEVLVPERDETQNTIPANVSREPSCPVGADREKEESMLGEEGMTDTSSAWSSVDMSYSSLVLKGSQIRSLARDVAHTPEALQLHRKSLAMELLWLQQAIASRKKYLTLKQKLQTSE